MKIFFSSPNSLINKSIVFVILNGDSKKTTGQSRVLIFSINFLVFFLGQKPMNKKLLLFIPETDNADVMLDAPGFGIILISLSCFHSFIKSLSSLLGSLIPGLPKSVTSAIFLP